ncbi:hypothetical protein ALC62_04568 [Cyphomyrmex costatus]|uniref:Uncharacterized protein n=1 Tax=Cyphomyrmex costatus TaxID=456900 RepID=A0A195CVL6_9HYME|nr:hypothetical protein ALC62_04568 [Cyphomyrmex costatus]
MQGVCCARRKGERERENERQGNKNVVDGGGYRCGEATVRTQRVYLSCFYRLTRTSGPAGRLAGWLAGWQAGRQAAYKGEARPSKYIYAYIFYEKPGVDIVCLPGDTSVEINVRRVEERPAREPSAGLAGTPRAVNNNLLRQGTKIMSISHKEKKSKVRYPRWKSPSFCARARTRIVKNCAATLCRNCAGRQLLVISIPHARRPEKLTFSVPRTHDPRARERLESSPCKLPSLVPNARGDVPRRVEGPEYIKETHSGNHSETRCTTHHVSSCWYTRANALDSTARR